MDWKQKNLSLIDGLHTLSTKSRTSFQASDKFESFEWWYFSSIKLVFEVTRFNSDQVLEERAAFLITFVNDHTCKTLPITTFVREVVRNVSEPTQCLKMFGDPDLGLLLLETMVKISSFFFSLFFEDLLWYDNFWPSLDSHCTVLKQWCQKLDGKQWRVVVR